MQLRDWRRSKGLTQVALAADLDIHPQYLSDIERGVRAAGTRLSLRIKVRTNGAVTPNDLAAPIERRDAA